MKLDFARDFSARGCPDSTVVPNSIINLGDLSANSNDNEDTNSDIQKIYNSFKQIFGKPTPLARLPIFGPKSAPKTAFKKIWAYSGNNI